MSDSQNVTIRTDDERELAFSGKLIAEARRSKSVLSEGELWFHLEVWSNDAGGFVPVLRLFTYDGKPTFTEAEQVDSMTDVENFFFVFEPSEVLPALLGRLNVDDTQRRSNQAYAAYEGRVNELLLQFADRKKTETNESTIAEKL